MGKTKKKMSLRFISECFDCNSSIYLSCKPAHFLIKIAITLLILKKKCLLVADFVKNVKNSFILIWKKIFDREYNKIFFKGQYFQDTNLSKIGQTLIKKD